MTQKLLTTNIVIPLLGQAGTLGGPQSGNVPILRIPGTSYGGGITITRWDYTTNVVLAVGSAPAVRLVSQTVANLPIATLCSNGSAATTAGTAITGTITTAWVPGTVGFLGLEYSQATYGGTSPAYMVVSVQYHNGRGSA